MGLKMSEVLLILVVVLLLFGTSRLPQLGQSLGSAIRNFKKGFEGKDSPEDHDAAAANKVPGVLSSSTEAKDASAPAATSVAPKNS
jgi:TatA/E family protein of Tat protein translocase